MKEEITNKMGIKPVFPLLMTMAFPPMLSMLIQSLYNIVDGVFVAQYSQEALTAVSLAFPIQNLILAVAVGTGIGINSYISRKLGEKNFEDANLAVTHGLILAIISYLVFVVLGIIFIKPFFAMFTNSEHIITMGCEYTYIIVFLCFGTIIHIAIEKVLQATGKMIYPMLLQTIGAIVNIILDPIMIFGLFGFPEMGIKGAAIATAIGQITAMILSILVMLYQKHDVKIEIKNFKFEFAIVKEIYAVGFPSILMNSLGSVLVMGLNAILVTFSALAVSVFGIYFKLQTFVYMPVSGLIQGAMPIMGYNYGARNRQRLIDTLKSSMLVSAGIMLLGNIVFCAFPIQLLRIFNATEEMLAMGTITMRIISCSYVPAAIGFVFSTLFQSVGKGFYSLIIFLMRQIVIVMPLAYILSGPMGFGLEGIWVSFIIAEVTSALIATAMFANIYKSESIFRKN